MTTLALSADAVRRQRAACAAAIDTFATDDPGLRQICDSIAHDLRAVEPLILSVPLSGLVAAELLAELAGDGGVLSSLPMLTRMACAQYVAAVADHAAEHVRPVLYQLADLVRAASLVESGYVRVAQ